jgi:hypothetical protein
MEQANRARATVAGPVALLAAFLGMAVTAALSNLAQWPFYVFIAIFPAALCMWLTPPAGPSIKALLILATLVMTVTVAAAVVFLLLPLFEVTGVGISGAGVYTLLWGPSIVVFLGSIVLRARSDAPLLGLWLLWWVALAAATIWAEPLTYALTDLGGADAMAGSVAVLASPTVGMSAWVGAVSTHLIRSWSMRGHLTSAST